MSKDLTPQENEIIFYTTPDGAVHVEVFFQNETFWLSQKKLADLFGVEVNTINYHLKEIFKSGELQELATIRKIRIVQKEGNRNVARDVDFYNLDAIIAVGYRVNSFQANQFRVWATRDLWPDRSGDYQRLRFYLLRMMPSHHCDAWRHRR